MDRDKVTLIKIQQSRKERPHIAKLLSRKDFDPFELDALMTDEDSSPDLGSFEHDTSFSDFE